MLVTTDDTEFHSPPRHSLWKAGRGDTEEFLMVLSVVLPAPAFGPMGGPGWPFCGSVVSSLLMKPVVKEVVG